MKKVLLLLAFVCIFPFQEFAQNLGWLQKATFGGDARHRSTAVSIGNRGYMGLGHVNSVVDVLYKDWWEYDPATNTWTQKADYPPGKRFYAAGFSVDSYAYVGTGRDTTFNNTTDFWRYNIMDNSWNQISNFPGQPRRGAVAFEINGIGYVGTGTGYSNFFAYNTQTGIWSPIASLPASGRTASVAFSIGNYGYLGTGDVGGSPSADFWRYNPSTNTWTQMAFLPGLPRMEATGFELMGKGYIGTGCDFQSGNNYGDFWRYDPSSNSWAHVADFGGSARRYMSSFTIGSRGYSGLGTSGANYQDFWEYGSLSGENELTENEKNISVYPNPVISFATIEIKDASLIKKGTTFELYDMQGKFIQKLEIKNQKTEFYKNDIPLGNYIYSIYNGAELIGSGKLLIQ